MQLSTQGITDPHKLGDNDPLPGKYHAVVKSIDDTFSNAKLPETIFVELEILAGTVPGQVGKTTDALFGVKPEHQERLKRFAMIVGLIGPNEQRNVRFSDAIGRQLIIEVQKRKDKNNVERIGVPMFGSGGVWAIGHPDVRDVPCDAAMLALHSQARTAAPQAAPAAAPQQAVPTAAAQPAAAPAPDWSSV